MSQRFNVRRVIWSKCAGGGSAGGFGPTGGWSKGQGRFFPWGVHINLEVGAWRGREPFKSSLP